MDHRGSIRSAPRARKTKPGPEPITEADFKWMKRYIRAKADLPPGVRVRWILDTELWRDGWNGLCTDKSPTYFEIRIASQLSAYHAFDVCIHEIAHVRQAILHPEEQDDHGPGFGIEHAFIWRRLSDDEA